MYFGATVFMWFVRAWKLRELESKAVAMHTSPDKLDLMTETPSRGTSNRHGGDVSRKILQTLVQIRKSIDLGCTRMHVLCPMIHSLSVSLSSYISNKYLANLDKDEKNALGPAFCVWSRSILSDNPLEPAESTRFVTTNHLSPYLCFY